LLRNPATRATGTIGKTGALMEIGAFVGEFAGGTWAVTG
jgi:hypothetical protein